MSFAASTDADCQTIPLAWPDARTGKSATFALVSRVMHPKSELAQRTSPTTSSGSVASGPDTAGDACSRDDLLAALLQASAKGDARAFEQFYNATVRQAMAVARRIAGDSHAEDVLAEAYFQIWRHAARFDAARGTPLSWLLTVVRSRALDRLRQETLRHGGHSGAPEWDPERSEAAAEPGPEHLLDSLQQHTRLHAALAALSPNERWVLGLAFFRDCTHAEIAALTGLPLGTVKSLINRSQHKLRGRLQPDSGVPRAAATLT